MIINRNIGFIDAGTIKMAEF